MICQRCEIIDTKTTIRFYGHSGYLTAREGVWQALGNLISHRTKHTTGHAKKKRIVNKHPEKSTYNTHNKTQHNIIHTIKLRTYKRILVLSRKTWTRQSTASKQEHDQNEKMKNETKTRTTTNEKRNVTYCATEVPLKRWNSPTFQPFLTAPAPIWSPISATLSDPPPSTTNTLPVPSSPVSRCRTRGLFSKHLTVSTWPEKRETPP